MDMSHVAGKTVMITGASRGIGAAAARAFVAAGARVALLARSEDAIEELAEQLGPHALAVPCDVTDYAQMVQAYAATVAGFGAVDVLVGNAGVIDPMGPLAEADPVAWGRAQDSNLKGVMYGMRVVLPDMIARGQGTIVTISSGAAHNPLGGWSAYCSSKAGAYMLTRVADAENRDHGVRIMGLSPGTVATQMQRDIKQSGIGPVSALDWSVHIPPEWPAQALIWMCSPEADVHLGTDISLRDENIRRQVGLI